MGRRGRLLLLLLGGSIRHTCYLNLKMINTQKRDISYTFANMLHRPILSEVIDDAWRADRLIDLDIVLDGKQSKQVKLDTNQEDD